MTLCTIKLNNSRYIVIVLQRKSWKCFVTSIYTYKIKVSVAFYSEIIAQ